MGKTPKTSKTLKKTAPKAKAPAKPVKVSSAKAAAPARTKAPAKKVAKETKGSKVTKKVGAAAAPPAPPVSAATPARKESGAAAAGSAGPTKSPGAAKPSSGKGSGAASSAPPAPAPSTAPTVKAPAAANAEAAGADKSADKKKVGPKGITIVHPKPSKPSKPKPKFQLPQGEPLLKPGAKWKPLIPSGPGAPPRSDLEHAGPGDGTPIKTKLTKKELERYRQVLLAKRAELVGDVRNMESEALLQNSGSLSHTPQHMAEQGTDVFDQSLNLDLAAVDRTLIREIDAALERIEAGTFGVCELTGKLISAERLDELPWTRYSIEAARERERRSFQP